MTARPPAGGGSARPLPRSWTVSIAGHPVTVTADDPRLADALRAWLDHFAPGAAGPPRPPFRFDFHVAPETAPFPAPPNGRELVEYFYVRGVIEEGRPVFRGEDGSRLAIDVAGRSADASIPAATLESPPWILRDLFSAGLTWLLRAEGRFAVHAAAVRQGDTGLLIVGPPMSGKTTLALNFVRRGWAWVSDDKVTIESRGGRPLVTGLFGQSNVDPGLAAWFPELAGLAGRAPAHPHSPKRVVAIGDEYPVGSAPELTPTHLLFPEVIDAGPTRIESLAAPAALAALLRQSPMLNEPATARAQMTLLAATVSGAPAWRLKAGRDLLEDPGRLTVLGRAMGIDVGPPLPARHSPRA